MRLRLFFLASAFLLLIDKGQSWQILRPLVLEKRLPSQRVCWKHPSLSVAPLSASASDESNSFPEKREDQNSLVNMAVKAVGSSTTFVVAGIFFVVLAWKRDALMVSFFVGSISNGILSKVLKRIINQTRPPELADADIHLKPGDNGMPSSHAMSLGFISTFVSQQLPWTQMPLAIYVVLSLLYRVQVKLHTWQQILVGLVFGCLNGFAWFRLCVGDNPWGISVMDFVAKHFLDANGLLPIPMLAIPLVLGAMTVGSFERRIGMWLKKKKEE
jgi:dolichyldiphosphatase